MEVLEEEGVEEERRLKKLEVKVQVVKVDSLRLT